MPRSTLIGDLEWAALLVLGTECDDEIRARRVAELLSHPDLEVGQLIEAAMRHNLVLHLAELVDDPAVKPHLHRRTRNHLRNLFDANRFRNDQLTREALRVTSALADQGLAVACTKGVVLQYLLYDGRGTRVMSDIDLMIRPDQGPEVTAVLLGLGYRTGRYDLPTRTLQPLPRAEYVRYRLSPDHLPQFLLIRDGPVLPVSAVDCAYSLTWASSRWQVDVDAALSQLLDVICPVWTDGSTGSTVLPTLTAAYGWLFTVLHLFREAWIVDNVQQQLNTLAQFVDVARYWQRFRTDIQARVPPLIAAYDLAAPVAWVCAHTDQLFGSDLRQQLGLPDEAVSPSWLGSALGPDGRVMSWPATMSERLRRRDQLPLTEGSPDLAARLSR